MNRNPNQLGPRTLRDCTFQDWADPIERPKDKTHPVMFWYVVALCVAAAAVIVWAGVK